MIRGCSFRFIRGLLWQKNTCGFGDRILGTIVHRWFNDQLVKYRWLEKWTWSEHVWNTLIMQFLIMTRIHRPTWRFPKMRVPPNHPSHWTILVLKPIVTWGTPILGTPHMSIGCKYTPGQVPMLTWNHRLLGRSISRQCPSDYYFLQFCAFSPIHISTRDTTGIPPKDKTGSWYLDLPLVDEWSYGKSTVIQVCIRVSTYLNGEMHRA